MSNYNPNNPASQNSLILAHLRRGGTITNKTAALPPFNCERLSGRIFDLRHAGYDVKSRWKVVRSGKQVKEYYMETEG